MVSSWLILQLAASYWYSYVELNKLQSTYICADWRPSFSLLYLGMDKLLKVPAVRFTVVCPHGFVRYFRLERIVFDFFPINFYKIVETYQRKLAQGIFHLERMQNFPKNYYFLPPDTHQEVRNLSFFERFCVHTKLPIHRVNTHWTET